MKTSANTTTSGRLRLRAPALALLLGFGATLALAGGPPVSFDKAFMPDTIGPGSTSMLTFTIVNNGVAPVTDLAFDDEFPFGMSLAAPSLVSNDCGGTLTFDDDDVDPDFDVRLVEGSVGAGVTCEIVVNVIGTTDCAGERGIEGIECPNTSGDLTSSAGNSGSASASLFVDENLPGFTKSFDLPTVAFGGRSTLTLTIDNSASGSDAVSLNFIDNLPPGMVVADPANASTDCENPPVLPTLTALPGSSVISLSVFGNVLFPALGAGDSCTVTVDVVGGAVGELGNVSSDLLVVSTPAGKATAVLEVTGVEDLLEVAKEFTDDPVAPGGTVTLEFTVTNKSRDDSATNITFTDDLTATLADLTATGLPLTEACDPDPDDMVPGTGTLSGTTLLTFSGGTLPPETSCTFSVELAVPGAATPGTYSNTTSAVSGDVGGSPETGNMAGDLLFVVAFPVLTKEFTDDPVAAGDSVTLEFTITNPGTSAMSAIAFDDELTDKGGGVGGVGNGFLPFPVSVTLPGGSPCGGSLALVSPDTDRQALRLTGGSLAAAGSPGDSCTFSVTVDIPTDLPGGTYLNTTEPISATLDDVAGTPTVVGPTASDTIVIASAPTLTKEFTDDPVLPSGGPVTLEFNLLYDVEDGTPDATAIAFSDDLTALVPAVPGLAASGVALNTCTGATVDISTPTLIDFSGGTLSAGESCTVQVTLTVPAASPVGFHTNTTSEVTATVDGLMATNTAASDDLLITPLEFTKEFLDGGEPVIPGDTVTLRFTITNNGTSSTDDATAIAFTDTLSDILPGTPDVTAGAPTVNTCGGTEGGTPTVLSYSGGSLAFGSSCTVEYDLLVPAGVADGDYGNLTSSLTATVDGSGISVPPAADVLSLSTTKLELTKEFTDDPVLPDSPVTLLFTLTNLSATKDITDIAFTDDLAAALAGLTATDPPIANTCGGMAAALPATNFEYSGGSLLAGTSCTIELSVDVPAGPLAGSEFPNTTSEVTGKVGTLDVVGSAASDTLRVQTVILEKEFDDPTTATGTVGLTFTVTNLDSASGVNGLAFSDDLDAVISGLEAVPPPVFAAECLAGWTGSGTSFLTFSGGSLAPAGSPGDSCTFAVPVDMPVTATAGSFLNTTSELFSSGIPVADPATDFLDVEPAPTFAKEFVPDTIFTGETSTLTFTIDNTASALAATDLDFTDVLPSPVVVATPSGATTDCAGGTLTAMDGAGTITYTGGSVAAGASCTVSVDVTSDTAGMFVNTSGDLTSSSGNSGTAGDTLTVEPGEADLELVKTDRYEPVMAGGVQVYELTVSNLGPGLAQAVVLTDPLPVGTIPVYAAPAPACSEMGGVVTCDIGDLPSGDSFTAEIMVYVGLSEMLAPLDNLASVTSDTDDPDTGNNDVMEMTEVTPMSAVAALADVDSTGFTDVAVPLTGSLEVLVKDAGTLATVHQTEVFPDGWVLAGFEKRPGMGGAKDGVAVMAVEVATGFAEVRVVTGDTGGLVSTSVLPAGFLPVAMTVIPDDGTMRTLIAVAAMRLTDLLGHVFVFDSADGSLQSAFRLHPVAWPIDLTAVSSFAGDPLAELSILFVNKLNGFKRLQTKQLDGTLVNLVNLPSTQIPTASETVPNCCGMAADEVAVLGWAQAADEVRVRTVDADGGGLVSDSRYALFAAPAGLARVPNVAGSSADELVALYRNVADRAAVRMRDAAGGPTLLVTGFGPAGGSVPLGLAVAPNSFDTAADELTVYWLDPVSGDTFVTLIDAGSGSVVSVVPIP